MFMTDITIDNCVISEVGTDGYGMINFGKNIDQLEKVSITNSTLINIGDQLMDVKGGIGDVILENCTFYNSMEICDNAEFDFLRSEQRKENE